VLLFYLAEKLPVSAEIAYAASLPKKRCFSFHASYQSNLR